MGVKAAGGLAVMEVLQIPAGAVQVVKVQPGPWKRVPFCDVLYEPVLYGDIFYVFWVGQKKSLLNQIKGQ